jgi:hypothetical protein
MERPEAGLALAFAASAAAAAPTAPSVEPILEQGSSDEQDDDENDGKLGEHEEQDDDNVQGGEERCRENGGWRTVRCLLASSSVPPLQSLRQCLVPHVPSTPTQCPQAETGEEDDKQCEYGAAATPSSVRSLLPRQGEEKMVHRSCPLRVARSIYSSTPYLHWLCSFSICTRQAQDRQGTRGARDARV